MNDALQALLATFAPTYYDVLPVGPDSGITYSMFLAQDVNHESGQPLGQETNYMVRVFQPAETYSESATRAICAALRAAGWMIRNRGPLILDDAKTHYMYPIEITKWSEL